MSTAAGSKRRTTLQGFTVVAAEADLIILRRQAAALLHRLFREAQENGVAHLAVDGVTYILQRHADHTITIISGSTHERSVL